MSLGPAGIAAGAKIAGSLIGGRSARKAAKKQAAQAQYQFDQQMDYSIQRRVADAKKAGIHPLYALGASPGASPTMSMSGQHDSGSGLGDGIASAGSAIATGLQNKQANDIAQAQLAEQAKNNQAQRFRDRASGMRDLAAAFAATSAAKTSESKVNQQRTQPNVSDIPEPMKEDKGWTGSITTPTGKFQQRGKRTPASEVAERYGGAAEEIFGLWYLTQDLGSLLGNEVYDYVRRPKPTGENVDDYRLAP